MKPLKLICVVFAFCLCLTTFFGCVKPDDGLKVLSDKNLTESQCVKWEGRYAFLQSVDGQDTSGVMLYHTATGFTVAFYGTKLTVVFYHSENDIYYNFKLDDETLPNAAKNRTFCLPKTETTSTVTLVEGLEEGAHEVTCLKMDEPKDALTAVVSLSCDGRFVKRDADVDNARLKFLIVCASGGSGFGSLSYSETNAGVARTTKNSSSLHSFNYLTARMFDADVQFVAQAGWGLAFRTNAAIQSVLDYCGITPANTVAAAQQTPLWDYSAWVPDVILFNIGGNDTTQSSFDRTVYQQAVVSIVEKLHEKYPSAVMLWTHTGSNAGSYAMTALTSAGIIRQGYVKEAIIPKVGSDGTYGASSHNSFATHVATATILADALGSFGLAPVRQNVTFANFLDVLEQH